MKLGGGSDFRFQKWAHCSSRLLANCDMRVSRERRFRGAFRGEPAARKPRVKPGEKFPLTAALFDLEIAEPFADAELSRIKEMSRRLVQRLKKCRV